MLKTAPAWRLSPTHPTAKEPPMNDALPATLPDQETADCVRQIIISVLKLETAPADIAPHTSLHELGLDSMSVVELLTQIEIAFDIVIDVDDLSTDLFARFDTLVNLVGAKRNEAS
jgi:acyl carrier protein